MYMYVFENMYYVCYLKFWKSFKMYCMKIIIEIIVYTMDTKSSSYDIM